MSLFIRKVFESLLLDDLFMGRIEIPKENQQIFLFQIERQQFFNLLFYNSEIISLLERWKKDIKNIILKSMPKKKENFGQLHGFLTWKST